MRRAGLVPTLCILPLDLPPMGILLENNKDQPWGTVVILTDLHALAYSLVGVYTGQVVKMYCTV